MRRLIDCFLPEWDQRERHDTFVAAPPARVDLAMRSLSARELPLARALTTLRGIGKLTQGPTVLETMQRAGFAILGDWPGEEIVLGVAGRPWRTQIDRFDEFHAYDRPGSIRAVTNFVMAAEDGGTRVTTETRIKATDVDGRRWFRLYWLVVMPGSALIRREMLRALRKRAESS